MTALLELEELTIAYGGVVALDAVTVAVAAGETLAVLGANGAGKTTLLRAISGLVAPRGGSVRLDGRDITGERPDRIARRGVAHVADHRGLFPSLSVEENLRMGLYGAGLASGPDGQRAVTEVVELFPVLGERRRQLAGTMSGGQQQMLAIARALVQGPRLLLLDELSMGLAPAIVQDLFRVVADLGQRGVAVVLIEQFVDAALHVADHVAVLEQGRVVVEGPPSQLTADDLAAAYLGEVDRTATFPVPPPPDHACEAATTCLGPRETRRLERVATARGVTVSDLLREATDRLLEEEAP